MDEDRSCHVTAQVGSKLHIAGKSRSGLSVSSSRCGSRSHPWLLEAQTGQQVNVSLLDFSSGHGQRTQLDTRGPVSDDCGPGGVQYGYIVDKTNKNNVSVCSTDAQRRHKHVLRSAGNVVEIVLTSTQSADEDDDTSTNFLLAFEGTFLQLKLELRMVCYKSETILLIFFYNSAFIKLCKRNETFTIYC